MSLLRDIQETAIDSDIDISVLLRKCKVLAARLGNQEFKNWVESELNGYKKKDDLPEYRILSVISKGHFSGGFGSGLRNADIPMFCMPESTREALSHSYMMQPIAEIQSLVASSNGSTLQEPWSPDFVAVVGQDIYQYMNCMQAWKVIPHASLVGIIDAVRNRILSFVLEIEGEAPDAGEAPLNTNPIPQEKVSQVFNTYISGNVQNVSTGSHNVSHAGDFRIVENDLEALLSYLEENGVGGKDLDGLRSAIRDDKNGNPEEKAIGPRVMRWMTDMFNKAAKGTWKIGSDIATKVLTKAISSYYGL
ncbi:MAG: hypothetical protein HY607_07695 [Planctomycetes bacterium]|nr:hypothetical protein [Planctomycetota bacterium]